MAVKVNTNRLAFRLGRIVSNEFIDKKLLLEMGDILIKDVKGNMGTGKSGTRIDGTGNTKKFKSLATSTKDARRELARNNRTSDLYSNARSNLSFTGQLRDSIKTLIVNIRKRLVEVGPAATVRKPYKTKKGKNVKGKKLTNAELGDFHQNGGGKLPARPFLNVTQKTLNKINKLVLRRIAKILRKNNLT